MTWMIIVIIACIIFSGYFSATETAFTSLNRIRLKTKSEAGNKRAKLVLKLSDKYDWLLTTILIGNNIVNILASSLATIVFIQWCGGNQDLASVLSTVTITVIVLIFGEITPKSLAKEYPDTYASFSAPIINALGYILAPFNFIFSGWRKLMHLIFRHKEDNSITDEELISMVDEAEQEGGINSEESELIKSAIEFNDLEAKDVLIPRVDIAAIDCTASNEEIRALFAETDYSRLPVFSESVDNIIGILHEKDFIKQYNDKDFSLKKAMKPAVFVVPTTKILAVLQQLQKNKTHMAIVSGEYGETVGLITMEDILEELVGEIWDEHDEVTKEFTQVAENEYIVLGSVTVNDVVEKFGLRDIETDSVTVGGWVIDLLGKIPDEGDEVTFANLQITVTKTEARRINELKIIVLPEDEDADKDKD
ncbi:MAG: HlyC/CorC family transporter [Clostridiales bacterium]|nr:HlyC/CorC family transporter [Clostridiales bacterium]